MKTTRPLVSFIPFLALAFTLLLTAGCTTQLGDGQRQRALREAEANQKTVEKHGPLKIEGETKTEAYGPRQTQETSASVGFKISR